MTAARKPITTLLIIDPQYDFCSPRGALSVGGADASMDRLSKMVETNLSDIDQIVVTLDSHQPLHIANPLWWRNAAGDHPAPFTLITAADMRAGTWRPTRPDAHTHQWSLSYLEALEKGGRYPHTIWNPHCLIGTEGHAVTHPLQEALYHWASRRLSTVTFVTKGSNPWTEHFGAFRAEVPDPNDPSTQINTQLVNVIEQSDRILCAGEALTHCLMHSLKDLIGAFQDPKAVGKMTLLTDAADPIPDPPSVPGLFSGALKQFLASAHGSGLKTATTLTAF